MLRNRAVALLIGLALSPLVIALGLGPMQSGSFLNESFNGEIDILGVNANDYDTLSVRLAPLEQFERAGIELNPILYALRFEVDADRDVVRVTTRDPIREPYLNFLVEVNWAKGRLLREYTVLLDPPLYDNQRREPAAAPVAAPPATTSTATAAPELAPTAASTVRPGAYSAGGEVGPIDATDTLWSIAEAYRPDDSVTVQQMMLAILRENPDAFGENNINLLRRGAILRLPDEAAVRSVSASEAFAEAQRQHQLWEEYRNQVGAAPAPQPVGAPAGGSAPAEMAAPADEARLELAAPEGDEDGSGGDSAAGGSDTLLEEEIEARTQQSEELESKLTEAEEIIDLLQRQVNIQEDELAALQARLAELGIDESEVDIAALREQAMAAAGETGDAADAGMDEAATDETDAADEMADDAGDSEPATAAEAETETVATEPEPKPAKQPAPKPAAPAERGFPESLVPEQIAALVPGGALTILGAIAVVLLGLFAGIISFLMRRGGSEATSEAPAPAAAAAVAEDDATEDPTITASTAVADDDGSEDPTTVAAAGDEFDPNATVESEEEFDPNATVEAPAAEEGGEAEAAPTPEAAAAVEEEDPLEEVNVYLAYERFEQAEELVTRVIGEYPDRHEYKLRLLEVYYSANDRASYEKAARDLLDAVGEGDPLWDSAVAMWSEMSPDRALFAEGEDVPAEAPAADAASAFVDITGDEDAAPGEDTVAHAPGSDDDAGVDFDLSSDGGDAIDLTATSDGDVLDLTAAADGDDVDLAATGDGDVLDLTAEAGDDVVDLTDGTADGDFAGDAELLEAEDGGVLDITSGDDAEGDLLDLTGGSDGEEVTDLLDAAGGDDLLDVTKTGDVSSMDDADLLNVTSPGMHDAEETVATGSDADETSLELDVQSPESGDGGEIEPDFDISETVATAFDEGDGSGDEVLDLTSAEEPAGADADAADGGDDLLDFDIGGLDEAADGAAEIDSEATTLVDGNEIDAVTEAAEGGELDFDLTMGEDDLNAGLQAEDAADGDGLDLDLGSGDDDLTVELRPSEDAGDLNIEESEDDEGRLEITMSSTVGDAVDGGLEDSLDDVLDGEISLQGDELDELALDDTSGSAPSLDDDFDIALEGTTEMDSIAADDTVDMASMASGAEEVSLDDLSSELDSALDDASLDDLDIGGLDIEGAPEGDGDDGQLETVQLENTADLDIETDDEKTVVMPVADNVETQSDADEADTKLNLAKAYIELGDNEGARSILDEVAASGDDAQKQEAQTLLDQLSG